MYFTRNTYALTFATNYPGDAQFTSGEARSENHTVANVPYEASLAPYGNAAPSFTAPDHYVFDGWYEDQSCTVPFDFNQTMPAANKVVYAKWYPVYYLIQIDPNGGTIAGRANPNESTYFWLQYGMTIGQYGTTRQYIETTAAEAAELGAETYYYRYVSPTLNENGTVLEHSAWTGSNKATLWGSDLDSQKDNEGIRPAFYRMAEYVKFSDYHQDNDTFYQYMVANGGQALAEEWDRHYVDTGKLYRLVTDTDPAWTFVGWYRDGHPYDFTSAVTSDVTLEALWRQAGKYYLNYNPSMVVEGVVGTLSGPAYDPDLSGDGYIDKATTHVATAPNEIHGINQSTSGNTYIFEGWRVVDSNGNPLDENGNILTVEQFNADPERYLYQPGDEIMIRSEQAHVKDGHNVIELRAYYRKVEDSNRYPDVVQLTLDANTKYLGYVDPDAAAWPAWAEPGSSTVDANTTSAVGGEMHPYQIVFGDAQENQGIHLINYRPFFVNAEGYFLLGFDPKPDPEDCAGGPYIPMFAADAVIGVDALDVPNRLYAIWEPMVYVTFVNYTGAPVTISLNSLSGETAIEATVVNNATQAYERTAISEMNAVTVASGQTIRLVIPKGSDKDLNLSIGNNHIGFEMSATKQVGDAEAEQLFGGSDDDPNPAALQYGESYMDTQTLITSFTGIIYTLTEEPLDYAYFDVNGGTWTDDAHTASSQALATSEKPFWEVTEAGVYNGDYQIKIEKFMQPSDPTPPANTQFLGWTTDPYVAEIHDFSLTIAQLTELRDTAAAGSEYHELYAHLIDLIAEYKAAYGITEVTNLLQVVEAYSLWNFSNPPAGTVYYAVYAELATVNYHLMYRSGTNNSNHTWGLPVSGNTSTGQLGTVYTRSTLSDVDNSAHVVWSRQVVKGRSIIKPLAPSYSNTGEYTFLYWLKDDASHTTGSTTPSTVHPYSFVEPITGDLDLYTSWTGGYQVTLNVKKVATGAQSKASDAFNFRYYIYTYKYTYTGGETSRALFRTDSTGISLAGGEDRNVNLFYWTDDSGALYAQAVQIGETGLASSGYELTITDGEQRTSVGKVDRDSTLIFADNHTGKNYYRYYPVSNHAVTEGSTDYYMKGVTEKEQKTVWHFTKNNADLYFWNNHWYRDLNCTESATVPTDTQKVTFTNEKDARIRFIKVDENGYDRLNGAEFTLQKLENENLVGKELHLSTGYVKTLSETSGRNGRFILTPGETMENVRMDTDKNELVFMTQGTWRLTETKAPAGYYLPHELNSNAVDYVDISVSPTGVTLAGNATVASEVALSQLNIGEFDNDNEYAVVIQNAQKRAYFQIQKVDTAGTPLRNEPASFTVTGAAAASGSYVNLGTIQTDTTKDAKTAVQTVPYGTYTISETVAPNGYRLADDTILTIGDTVTATGNNVYGDVSGTGTSNDPYILQIKDEQTGYNLTLKKIAVHEPEPEPEKTIVYKVTVQAQAGESAEAGTAPATAGKTYNLVTVDAANNSANSSVTFDDDGKAEVSIQSGYAVTLRSLPGGRYTITEETGAYSARIVVVQPSTNHILIDKVGGSTPPFTLSTATTATITNTYGVPVKILKVDQEDKPLAGAEFSLVGVGGNINEQQLVSANRTIRVDDQEITEALIYESDVLPLGTYTLTETETPAGYIAPEAPVIIVVDSGENGENGITVSASINEKKLGPPNLEYDYTTGLWTIRITNTIGYALPATGGPGTGLLYLLGSMLILFAGAAMAIKRKRRRPN